MKKAGIEALRMRLAEIAEAERPMSVRNLFYRAVTEGLVPKTEAAYKRIIRLKKAMCEEGQVHWSWFTDGSRTVFRNAGYGGVGDAEFHHEVVQLYRRDMWRQTGILPQIWYESRSMAPALSPVAAEYGIDLFPTGGMTSDSYIYNAAADIGGRGTASRAYLVRGRLGPERPGYRCQHSEQVGVFRP